ncbi:bacillithiol system redox-active protein YtxJ [Salipaludibacillus agaradhaerens]|uniref:Bacillithiol system redox-active protein YtxJ n=1 Tax=Salipaludibacillus agaradhaerens TaxID=76935 RepID=A0A9Q4FV90_SALAG|nr:bacillithiol system redox-active protein YtxJ [Salipaludibacillus agaradhaerens]MCR6095490.1 bacillithiol system redox-active protein YtxJ [Salipaludibacillus agaradhaerens]MCR6114950.1 bacillithiol system redox-active protein YtxJ [Salipaludibacillus agaradhaerens]
MNKLTDSTELTQLLKNEATFFLLKNSTTCPVSSDAFQEMETYAKTNETLPVYYLNVQELRDVSNKVAEDFDIKHESPQLILFKQGKAVWNTSHWNVTGKNAEEAVAEFS